VECMGNCSNAPMVQINDDNYEDLDYDIMTRILEDLAAGKDIKVGSQIGRKTSEAEGGPTNLQAMVEENHDYRKEW
ncbi:MAG: NAD(P)H-dependent oxidoreductase subunit E, partial [Parasphingorhabdus sp.]